MIKVPAKGSGSNNYVGSLLDYLGFPVEMPYATGVTYEEFSALPVREYALIADTWYRSQEVTDPINIYYGDNDVVASTDASYINDVPQGGKPFRVSKFRDYFSSALPSPQRGSEVLLPIQQFAPVYAREQQIPQPLSHEGMMLTNTETNVQRFAGLSDLVSGGQRYAQFNPFGSDYSTVSGSMTDATWRRIIFGLTFLRRLLLASTT